MTSHAVAEMKPDELEEHLGAFGASLVLRRPSLCPEFELWLLGDGVDLEEGCGELAEGEAPPFWAFCWGSGQALARYVLDHPDRVRDKHVVDLGTGSGIAALAAARAGAKTVLALDLDPTAHRAAKMNAEHNGLEIETSATAPEHWDLMLAADVLYETGLRDWVMDTARTRGPILLADPERTGTPHLDLPVLTRMSATTFPDVDSPQRSVVLRELSKRP
jgi:predicted nicotinamide N-methyase